MGHASPIILNFNNKISYTRESLSRAYSLADFTRSTISRTSVIDSPKVETNLWALVFSLSRKAVATTNIL